MNPGLLLFSWLHPRWLQAVSENVPTEKRVCVWGVISKPVLICSVFSREEGNVIYSSSTDGEIEGVVCVPAVAANVCRTPEVAQADLCALASLRVAWKSLPRTAGTDTALRSSQKLETVAACEAGVRDPGRGAWEVTSPCLLNRWNLALCV